jgi:hypothetical protein
MREEIAGLATNVTLGRDQWLFREGDPADGVYVVRVGHLEVLHDGPEPESINTLTRGAVLGELALLSHSVRSASVRALRDTELLKIDRDSFETLLRSEPELALSLTRVLSTQLQASRWLPPARRARPVTIALRAGSTGVPLMKFADELSRAMCAWGKVAVLHPEEAQGVSGNGGSAVGETRAEAIARFAPLVERCEEDHDQVIMVCGSGDQGSSWEEFCISRADRVLVLVDAGAEAEAQPNVGAGREVAALHGSDLVGLGVQAGSGRMTEWLELLEPADVFAVSAEAHGADVALMARRLAGRSLVSCSRVAAHEHSPISGYSTCCSTREWSSTVSAGSAWGRSSAGCSPPDTTAPQSTPTATRSG